MKGQIAPFDIGIMMIALAFLVVIFLFLSIFIETRAQVNVNIIYDTNEANRILTSLISLNYSSKNVYELISSIEYTDDPNFIKFLNESLYGYFDYTPKCYKLTLDSTTILDFKNEGYSGDCKKTRFSAKIPIFTPYNKINPVKYLYLNYER
jgi:hypothetical protein